MHITSTHDLLIIENRPWVVAVLLGAAMFGFAATGVFALLDSEWMLVLGCLGGIAFLTIFVWAFVRRNQLVLNGLDGSVTHSRRTIFSYWRVEYKLAHLERGSVDTSTSGDNGATYRMIMHITGGMNAGVHPFTHAYTSGTGADRAAKAVNDWLNDTRKRGDASLDSGPAQA